MKHLELIRPVAELPPKQVMWAIRELLTMWACSTKSKVFLQTWTSHQDGPDIFEAGDDAFRGRIDLTFADWQAEKARWLFSSMGGDYDNPPNPPLRVTKEQLLKRDIEVVP